MVHNSRSKFKFLICIPVILLTIITSVYSVNPNSFIIIAKPKDIWPPAVVTDLVAVATAVEGQVKLNWTAPTEDFGMVILSPVSGYYIKFATFSVDSLGGDTIAWWNSATYQIEQKFANNPGTKEELVINGLTPGVTYYFAIKSYDDAIPIPNISQIDTKSSTPGQQASVMLPIIDKIPPREPLGVKGIVSPDRTTMTLQWSPVTKNEDGTPCNDLLGYNIYRSSFVYGGYLLKGFVPAGQPLTWTDQENIEGRVFYYMIRAVDTSGNLSKISMIADSSIKMNIIAADEQDLSTRLTIPREINHILYKDTNQYGADIKIEVIRVRKEEQGRVIKSCSFIIKKGYTEEIIKDFVFAKPLAKITIGYEVENGFVKTGNDVLIIPENEVTTKLSLFWFNGLEWIKLGGKVDEYSRTVSIKSDRVGKYKIKYSLRATSFEIMAIQPDKIFTPNGDGWNDYFEIFYANPKDSIVKGKIFDLKSAYVADMKPGNVKGEIDGSLVWDGKDFKGRAVPGGVYIYQIEISGPESKIINGTCIVAR